MSTSRIARVLAAPVIAAGVLLMGTGSATATQSDEPVADATFGDVTVTVTRFERTSGRTLTAEFAIANDGTEEFDLYDHFGEDVNDWTMGGVFVFDEGNSTNYLSLREGGEENGCNCTDLRTSTETIEPGEERHFFVKVPAPPASTETASLVLPPVGTVDGIEIAE